MFKTLLLTAALMFSLPALAFAKDADKIGSYGKWTAYSFQEDGKKVCYMAATPDETKGDYKKRGSVYAMVTHRPADKTLNVFSYLAGYEYAQGARVTLSIDGAPVVLLGSGETAWTPNDETDQKLVAAMRKGSKMIVEGSSAKGTTTKDIYSLRGSGSAYDAMSKACDIIQ